MTGKRESSRAAAAARARKAGSPAQAAAPVAPPRRLRSVLKRDGREVPFEVVKIEAAIRAAMAAVGYEDATFAREVASVVELTLSQRAPAPGEAPLGPPHIEAIQDLVERALMELGAPAVAKAYILYREKRAGVRDALQVHASGSGASFVGAAPRVREAEGVAPWSKGRIVAALMGEAELARPQAEDVAAAVERRVLSSGLGRVTTGLVRELVASELFERGWTRALQRQGAIGLARADIEALLVGRSVFAWQRAHDEGKPAARRVPPARAVAGELLRRWSSDEVLPDEVADLVLAGDLHVEHLGTPHVPLVLGLEAELFALGGGAGDAFALLEELAALAPHAGAGLVLEEPAPLLAPLVRATRPKSSVGLGAWLRALRALERGTGLALDLSLGDARQSGLAARLVSELHALVEGGTAQAGPRLFLDGHLLEGLLSEHPDHAALVEELLARGTLVPTWGEGGTRCVGPGLDRRAGERAPIALVAAVALNLPRLARRAGPWREEIVLSGLAELVRAALAAGRALGDFQRQANDARPAGLHARPSISLVPVGLREALLVLGDGVVDPDQGARLIGLVADAARRFAPAEKLAITVASFHGEAAAARFAWLDERNARADGGVQRWLFAEAGEAPPARPYTADFGLRGVAASGASGRAEAELLRTLPSGAIALASVTGDLDDEVRPHLAAWRRFEVRRRAFAGEVSLELFPPGGPRILRPVH